MLVDTLPQVRLLLLAAMAGEHILLIGPPGTAKSEVGRRLNKLIAGTYFERLLTRFSVPEVRSRVDSDGLEWLASAQAFSMPMFVVFMHHCIGKVCSMCDTHHVPPTSSNLAGVG